VRLSPLYPLPIPFQDSPAAPWLPLAAGLTGLVAVTALAWTVRKRWPIAGAAWAMYLSLLAPIAGLTPSGIQATADRYMYLPGVLIAIVAGMAGAAGARLATSGGARKAAALTAATVILVLGTLTWRQAGYWRDSITLWARAADVDAGNDVAAYNLAVALAGAGREEDAIAWYERTLSLVPDHDLARGNLAILQAAQAERNADRLASQGRVREAAEEYARALSLDAKRSHARAARGMLLLKSGRLHEAIGELRLALAGDVKDVEVPNALAFALAQTGETPEAARVLERAAALYPDDVNVKHNLARMLATATDPQVRDGARAVQLAMEVCERTAFQDPRALDTLSAAYAASGQRDLARATAARAEARARELGDADMAAAITEHARSYGR
jgi:tetratricopeptide (TPR) repeat protein